jgi:hypothetical protein
MPQSLGAWWLTIGIEKKKNGVTSNYFPYCKLEAAK